MSTPLPTRLSTQGTPRVVSLLQAFQPVASAPSKQRCALSVTALWRWGLRRSLGGALVVLLPLGITTTVAQGAGATEASMSDARMSTPQLLAQQVIDGLPPPPPIPDLQIPDGAGQSSVGGQGSDRQSQDDSGELYMVYVNGDSPLLLEQVQQVESTARVQSLEGQQVIFAGLFEGPTTANEQVEKLSQRGIDANVVSGSSVILSPSSDRPASRTPELPSQTAPASLADLPPADSVGPVNPASSRPRPGVSVAPPASSTPSNTARVTSPPTPTRVTNAPRQDNAYYVVIPGEENELGGLWEQVVLLGAKPSSVEQRDRPLGHHLLVGPFVDQDAATRWNRYFQDFGMEARVYYKR